MDDLTLAQVTSFVLSNYGPGGLALVTTLASVAAWWSSVSKHLCEAVPQMLTILGKFADNGVRIHLRIHMVDKDEDE